MVLHKLKEIEGLSIRQISRLTGESFNIVKRGLMTQQKRPPVSRVFGHSKQNFIKGFNMLTLSWTDGYSFVPVDFAMLSSAKETNRKITSLIVLVALIISVFSFQIFAAQCNPRTNYTLNIERGFIR